MQHPHTRAERRHERERVIARRRKVAIEEWGYNDYFWLYTHGWKSYDEWGRYAKFNGGCGCATCHAAKYFKFKSKRRILLNTAESTTELRREDRTFDW